MIASSEKALEQDLAQSFHLKPFEDILDIQEGNEIHDFKNASDTNENKIELKQTVLEWLAKDDRIDQNTLEVYWKTGLPITENDLQAAALSYFSGINTGSPFVLQMLETQIGLVSNIFNLKTTSSTQDIIESPSINTLLVLGTATFTLIEVT